MRFDQFWDDDDVATSENDRPLPPDGKAAGTITTVLTRDESWAKHERNPSGRCLRVKIDLGMQYRPLWDSLPLHWRGKLCDLCASARVPQPSRGSEWDERALLEKAVAIDILRGVSARGTEYVRIDRYLPQADLPPAPEPRPAPETQPEARRRRAAPVSGGADDVPF